MNFTRFSNLAAYIAETNLLKHENISQHKNRGRTIHLVAKVHETEKKKKTQMTK